MLQDSYIWPCKALRHIKGHSSLSELHDPAPKVPCRHNHINDHMSSSFTLFHKPTLPISKSVSIWILPYRENKALRYLEQIIIIITWQHYYYSVPPALSFSTIATETHLFSLDLSEALQFLSSSSSDGEKLQCCAGPENVSAKNMLCSSLVGRMPHRMTQPAENNLKLWKWDTAFPSAMNSSTALAPKIVRGYGSFAYSSHHPLTLCMIKMLHCGDTSSHKIGEINLREQDALFWKMIQFIYMLYRSESLRREFASKTKLFGFIPCSNSQSYTICSSIIVLIASLFLLLSIFLMLNFLNIIFLYIINFEFSKQTFLGLLISFLYLQSPFAHLFYFCFH